MGALELIIYDKSNNINPIDINTIRSFMDLSYRGPDSSTIGYAETPSRSGAQATKMRKVLTKRQLAAYRQYQYIWGYHRLCINDLTENGDQPFIDPIQHRSTNASRDCRMLLCNGEIYNYSQLVSTYNFGEDDLQSTSDCEVILPLWIRKMETLGAEDAFVATLNELNGDFSCAVTQGIQSLNLENNKNMSTFEIDTKLQTFVARDPLGIRPLYMIKHRTAFFYMFVTEIKEIQIGRILRDRNFVLCEVPPGHYWSFQNPGVFTKYSDFGIYRTLDYCTIVDANPDTLTGVYTEINARVTSAVRTRFGNSEKPIGVMLSGGFDSSIIFALVCEYLAEQGSTETLNVFTMGDTNSDDVVCAERCVEYFQNVYPGLDIQHHIVTVGDLTKMVSAVDTTIYNLESYDADTIREAVPFSYLYSYIKNNTDVRVVLSGEGLDEIAGSYDSSLGDLQQQERNVDMLERIRQFRVLCSDKIAGSCGLEVRYPFLDYNFYSYVLSLHPILRRPQVYSNTGTEVDKYIIRKSFDGTLLDDVLWRANSIPCASFNGFVQMLVDYYNAMYTNTQLIEYNRARPGDTTLPQTKEELHYRLAFERAFPNSSGVIDTLYRQI